MYGIGGGTVSTLGADRVPLNSALIQLKDALTQSNILAQEIICALVGGGPEVAPATPERDGAVNAADNLTISAQALHKKLSEIREYIG